MDNLKKTIEETEKVIGKTIRYCEQSQAIFEDGYTYFRFSFEGKEYVGGIEGTDEIATAFATLLPARIEGGVEGQKSLSKTQFFKKLLHGESSPAFVYQYAKKFGVQDVFSFVAVVETPKLLQEVSALSMQYAGSGLDAAIETDDGRLTLLHFFDGKEEVVPSSYAQSLALFIKEELGIDVRIGVGPVVKSLTEIALSYQQALGALRYGEALSEREQVYSYKDFILVKMLEELPQSKLQQYFSLLSLDHVKEIFDDEEMMATAKEFLHNNLNVSEAARSMYLHRNTLTYRLDKIERATGLNIRTFADATSFHLLSLLYPLVNK